MELARHGVVGFFPAGGDGGGVKLLFLLLSVAVGGERLRNGRTLQQ